MSAFNRAWSMLKKQYTPPAGAERMPRPHPYGGDMPEGPDPLLRDPEQHRREGAMSDLLYRLINEAPIQTHGPLPPQTRIPHISNIPDRRPGALPGDYYRPKHAGMRMSEVHQPPIYRPSVAPPYYTAEHAPDEYYDMVESGDITPEMQTQMYRDAAHGM
jgi:hypothetical protein